jgi:hypothetical protein
MKQVRKYRYLKMNEIMREGDEVTPNKVHENGMIISGWAGSKREVLGYPIRRPIQPKEQKDQDTIEN